MSLNSDTFPDWSREQKRFFEWNPGKSLLASHRRYHRYSKLRWFSFFLRRVAVLQHRFWSVVSGADIPLNCQIGGGLLLPHPNGVVLHSRVIIGPNCLIFQQVTLGDKGGGAPTLGAHVDIGAGAKILGDISIGSNVVIGANAVVLRDVPANHLAVGIPARISIRERL